MVGVRVSGPCTFCGETTAPAEDGVGSFGPVPSHRRCAETFELARPRALLNRVLDGMYLEETTDPAGARIRRLCCPTTDPCNGHRAYDKRTCGFCHGEGSLEDADGFLLSCPRCWGSGDEPKDDT